MINTTVEINTPVSLVVKGPTSGLTSLPDLVLIKNGVIDNTTSVSFTDLSTQYLYGMGFSPSSTGVYYLHAFGEVQAKVEVVTQSLYNTVKNLQDEALGSWQWDKTTGVLTMVRRDGTTLATFNVVDNLTNSSRELIS